MGEVAREDLSWLIETKLGPRRVAGVITSRGEPVSGASVELRSELDQLAGEAPPRATTDAAGRFDLGPRPAAQSIAVVRAGDRRAIQVIDLADPSLATDRLCVPLGPPRERVRGRVVDLDRRPIAGAEIVWQVAGLDLAETATGAGGFEVAAPAAGGLLARAPGYAAAHVRDGGEIVLWPEARIAGVVLEADGRPLAGARALFIGGLQYVTTATDRDGRFELVGLAPAIGTVTADRPGSVSNGARIAVRAGERRDGVVIRAQPHRAITGRLLAGERGIAGVWVDGVFTDAEGRFELERVSHEGGTLFARGYAGPIAQIPPGRRSIDELRVRLAPPAALEGRVLCDGEPAGGVAVSARKPDAGGDAAAAVVVTDDAGRFCFASLEPGPIEVRASDVDRGRRSAVTTAALERGATRSVELDLSRAGAITGAVRDRDGRPVAGLELQARAGELRDRVTTAADGSFAVRGLAAGACEVSADGRRGSWPRPAGGTWPAIELATDRSTAEVELVIDGALDRELAGVVVDRADRPVNGARVEVFAGELSRVAWTDRDGRFAVGALPDESCTARAMAPSGAAAQLETRPGDGAITLRLREGSGAVDGRVIGGDVDTEISATWDPAIAGVVTTADRGGHFRIEGLPTGPVTLRAASGDRQGLARVEVRAGETVAAAIELDGPRPLEVQVRRFPGGEPAPAGLRCQIQYGAAEAMTDARGIARFEAPPRGEVAITGEDQDTRLGGLTALLLDSDTTTAELWIIEIPPDGVDSGDDIDLLPGDDNQSLVVSSVEPGGRAEQAGLIRGDRIVEVLGGAAVGAAWTAALVALKSYPHPVPVVVDRGGERVELSY